ncbi:MAG: oligosaccharide flippase family protein [Thermodesulfobacteriota bacterium]
MALSETHIRNIFIYTLPKFVSYGLHLITLPILTRILTPEDFGVITLSMAFPTIIVGIVTAGFTNSVPRYFFEYRKDRRKLNALYFSIQLYLFLMLIASTAFVYLTKDYLSSLVTGKTDYGFAVLIAYIAIYLGQINLVYLRIYQNMEKAVQHSSFVILQAVTSVAMSLLLVWYFRLSYMGMLYGSFIGALVACITMFVCFNKQVYVDFSRKVLLENIKYGLQVVPKSFTGFINRFFDKYMLNAMLSMSVVGIYNIGQTIAHAFEVLMNNVWMSFQPLSYRDVFDRGEKASSDVGRIFTIFSYITLFPVILGILFAQEIIYIIAPASYYGAGNVIVILAAGVMTQTFGMFVSVQYAYTKRPFWIFPITVIGTVFNVAANIYLIPRYGLIGAAFATMVSTTIVNALLTYIGQKLYKIQYEWGTIASLYALIMTAMVSVLYFRTMDYGNIYLYPLKLIFIILFALIGIKARIITKKSVEKVYGALFKFPQTREGL